MINIRKTDIIAILGKRGSGKSTFLKWLISKLKYSIVLLDTMLEHKRYGKHVMLVKPKPFKTQYNSLLKYAIELALNTKSILAIDELSYYQNPRNIPKKLNDFVQYGRHFNTGFIFTSRRPAEIHKNILANTNHFFIFKIDLPNDIYYLSSYVPIKLLHKLKRLTPHSFIYYGDYGVKVFKPLKL